MPPSRRAPSQTAIAGALRVSQATVSNALNGRRDQIATATYERIWAYAHSIGYRAKGLTPEATPHRQPTCVGVVLSDEFEAWAPPAGVAALQWSLGETLAAAGIACASLGSPERFRAAVFERWTAEGNGAAGIVLVGEVPDSFVARLKPRVARLVAVGAARSASVQSVESDDERAACALLRHLRELGHADVAWFGSAADDSARTAVNAVAAKLGLRISADYSLAASAPTAKAGVEAASAFASLRAIEGDAPTAIVCSSLVIARTARRELARHGLGVPRDVSLAGLRSWQESPEARDITCAGTTPAAFGAAAAKAMLESSSATKPVALAAELSVGSSTAAILPHAASAAAPTSHAA